MNKFHNHASRGSLVFAALQVLAPVFFGLLLSSQLSAQCCVGTNLITNPSLETDGTAPGNFNTTFQGTPASHDGLNGIAAGGALSFPANWDFMDAPGHYINGGDAQHGSRFVYTRGEGNSFNSFQPVTGCAVYRICFYAAAFTPTGTQGDALFRLDFQMFTAPNGTGSMIGAEPRIEFTAPASTSWSTLNWRQYSAIIVAPADAKSVLLKFSSGEKVNGICFDNFYMTNVSASVASNLDANNDLICGAPLNLYGLTNDSYVWPVAPQPTYSMEQPAAVVFTQSSINWLALSSLVILLFGLFKGMQPIFRHLLQQLYITERSSLRPGHAFANGLVCAFLLIAGVANAQVSGTVFRDFNANGVKDNSAAINEVGVDGVTITAFNGAGAQVGSVVSSATGTYSIPAISGKVRLEFTFPNTLGANINAPLAGVDFSSVKGSVYGTSVQFVTAPVANIDFALSYPGDYCQSVPTIVTPCYENGSGVSNNNPILVDFPYSASGSGSNHYATNATARNEGATWGVAFDKQRQYVFTSAFMKRQVGFGLRGPDGIYVHDFSGTGALIGGFDLQGVVPSNGGSAIDLGAVTRVLVASGPGDGLNELTADRTLPSRDDDAYAKVGKMSFGDIDIDEQTNTLWAVNLFQGSLIAIDLDKATVSATVPNTLAGSSVRQFYISMNAVSGEPTITGAPSCTRGVLRPFALKMYRGVGYLGAICDASGSSTIDGPAEQIAYILTFDPINPTTFTILYSFPLNYTRERSWVPFDVTLNALDADQWQRWKDTYSASDIKTGEYNLIGDPQPIFADIEVLPNNNLVLGFMDRFTAQQNNQNYAPGGNDADLHSISHGDILLLAKTAGGYTLEGPENDNNTGLPAAALPSSLLNDGPGGTGEFFYEDRFIGSNAIHLETTLGGLAALAGSEELVSVVFDPDEFYTQGVKWYSTTDGDLNKTYRILTGAFAAPAGFGKGAGLGDLELLCNPAPLEIGNRVWNDTHNFGVQDADENPIANVTMQLYAANGTTLLATAVTSASGQYFFSASGTPGQTWVNASGVNSEVQPHTSYIIRVGSADWSGGVGIGNLANLTLTTANVGGAGQPDARDNDAVLVTSVPQIAYTTGAAGESDHTLDMGFKMPVCSVNLTATVSGCYQNSGQSKTTVSIEVSWEDATISPTANDASDVITVTCGGQTRTINPGSYTSAGGNGTIVSPQVVAFELDADGSSQTIQAFFGANYATSTCKDEQIGVILPAACPPTICLGDQTGGTVFNDFNANGDQNSGETTGISGITVTAFDCNGNAIATATTDAHGKYVFSSLTMTDYPIRVEFSGLTATFGQGTPNGTTGRTTTQFVASPNCTVNLGVIAPADYCQNNPKVMIPCYVNGDPLAGGTAGSGTGLVGFAYGTSGGNSTPKEMLATASQIGSTWSVAYNKFTNKAYLSATLKRHVGLGPLGLGGIYVLDLATGTTTNFVDVTTGPLSINIGQSSVPTNSLRGLSATAAGTQSADSLVFSLIGKVGIGGMDISDDGQFLYFTNLFDKKIYKINIVGASPTLIGSFDVPDPNCANGNFRPFALKVKGTKVYVGSVCDGSTMASKSDMRAYVHVFDQTTSAFIPSPVFDFPLTYPKGKADGSGADVTGWFPWTDIFNDLRIVPSSNTLIHPQPVFVDLDFDVDGSMVFGFADRTGLQAGSENFRPNGTGIFSAYAGGDILRAANLNGTFILENNAKVGPITGSMPGNNEGPGFGEFYNDGWYDFLFGGPFLVHNENTLGGLAIRPGSGQTISTEFDPLDAAYGGVFLSNGIRYFSNATGDYAKNSTAGLVIFQGTNSVGLAGKAIGLGDVEMACGAPLYLQIGNYAWIDTDQDGVQDPCEATLPGISVSLYKIVAGNPTFVAVTTTNASGEYYFTGLNTPGETWVSTPGTDSLLPNMDYKIVFGYNGQTSTPQFSANQLTIAGTDYALTTANTGEGTTPDQNDSDASLMNIAGGSYPSIALTTGNAGTVNHTYDAGFKAGCSITAAGATAICNDNGTGTAADDYFTLTTNPTGSGIGLQYNVSVLHNGATTNYGPFNYGAASAAFGNFLISQGNAQVTITDVTAGGCSLGPVTVNAPASCSVCSITAAGATAICNDNGTGTAADDYFTLTTNPTGSGIGTQYNVSVLHNGATTNYGPFNYGAASAAFGHFLISQGNAQVTITDVTSGGCSLGPVTVNAPATCSVCSITAAGATAICNDNGTGTAVDDYFTLMTNPTGNGVGTQYNVTVVHNGATTNYGPFTYGVASAAFGTFLISQGNAQVTITDVISGGCSLGPVTVNAPATCSVCSIATAGALVACNDNATGTTADDYFTMTTNPTGNGIGTQYNVVVVHNGATTNYGPFTYGASSSAFGNFLISQGNALVTINDATTGGCTLGPVMVNAPATCSIAKDYGDLPDSYGTLIASGGACHTITPNLKLGACVDGEPDGQPEPMAGLMTGGDDGNVGYGTQGTCTTAGDDDNGILFSSPMIPGQTACISVTAMNMTGAAALLQGWIDFNSDGDVLDAGEALVFTGGGTIPVGGVNNQSFCFPVPANAVFTNGNAFVRIRLSSAGGLGPTGNAPDGEVEDYKVQLSKIGNLVWNDWNNNGQQDLGEPGLNGVTVQLVWAGADGNIATVADNVTYTQVTSNMGYNGMYMFTGLTPGTYVVSVPTTPTNFVSTQNDSGSDVTDSDNPAGVTVVIPNPATTLPLGENGLGDVPNDPIYPDAQNNLTLDFGFIIKDFGDLPNTYGTDATSNGPTHIVNSNLQLGACIDGETNGQPEPMAGMMTGGDDNTAGSTATGATSTCGDDEDGVVFETPLVPGNTACIRVTAVNTTGAAAVLQGWIDFNSDGDVLDAGEALTLTNGGVIPIGGVTNQQYCFNVPATAAFAGGNLFSRFRLSPLGDLTPNGPATVPFPIGEVEDYKVQLVKIGNLVWNDWNNNGQQNIGEPGLNGVTVQLVWAGSDGNIATVADNLTYTQVTSNMGYNGMYMFTGLTPGTYVVSVPTTPTNFVSTQIDLGNDVTDSDNPVGTTVVIPNPLTSLPLGENGLGDVPNTPAYPDAQNILTIDFGFIIKDFGDLPNTYGTDATSNGPMHVLNPSLQLGTCIDGETNGQPEPMAGMMTGGDDNTAGSTTTGAASTCGDDEDGIVFETPLIPGTSACIRVSAINTTGAAAVLQGWIDFNGDGDLLDAGEALVLTSNAAVPTGIATWRYCFPVPATATFTGGNVFSRFRLSPAGGLTPNGPATAPFPIGEVEDYKVQLVKIGNLVWNDSNNNGQQDLGEPGLNGITVQMVWAGSDGNIATVADNVTYTQVTSNMGYNGMYMFTGLTPGTYVVSVPTTPTNFVSTQNDSGSDVTDSDNPAGVTVVIPNPATTLPLGENGLGDVPNDPIYPDAQNNLTLDFGFIIKDYGDLPNTYGTNSTSNGPTHIVNSNLQLGACIDGETNGQPEPMAGMMTGGDDNTAGSTATGAASTCGDDEDGVVFETPLVPGNTACIRVTAVNTTGAAAVLQGWIDFNGDGDVLDAGEALTLTNGGVIPINGAINQQYCFPVPATATYQGGNVFSRFRLSPLGGLTPNGPATAPFPIGEVEDYKLPVALIGNYVWMDSDLEGDQEAAEMLLAGVPVVLVWSGPDGVFGNADDRRYNTITDATGRYVFGGLLPTTTYQIVPQKYTVPQVQAAAINPINKILTLPNQALANDNNDSDGLPAITPIVIPNLTTVFLPTAENGVADNNSLNGFPDNQENLSFDLGFIDEPRLAAAMSIQGFQPTVCGQFGVIMDLCINNTSTVPLANLQAVLDLAGSNAYGTAYQGMIGTLEIVSSTAHQNPVLNSGYNGNNTNTMFNGNSGLLWPGEQVCIRVRFNVNPLAAGAPANPQSRALVSGKAVNYQGVPIPDFFNNGQQYMAMDASDAGTNPLTNNPDALGNSGGFDDPTPLGNCWQTTQSMACNDLVNISLDGACRLLVTPGMLLEGENDNCLENVYPLGSFFEVIITTLQGAPVPNPIPAQYLGQTLRVSIRHIMTCNSCWGTLKVEDKLAPVITCASFTVPCNTANLTPAYLFGTLGVVAAQPIVTDCSAFTLVYIDSEVQENCASGLSKTITRKWTATDAYGNSATCVQTIGLIRPTLADLVCPPNYDNIGLPAFNCLAGVYPTPDYIEGRSLQGYPYVFGHPSSCNINYGYTDLVIPICDATYKIIRTWTVIDWCTGQNEDCQQIIKVLDNEGPSFVCPADLTVSANQNHCCAYVDLPDVLITDNCSHIGSIQAMVATFDPFIPAQQTGMFAINGTLSTYPGNNLWVPDTLGVFGLNTTCMPLGTHTVTYIVADKCGNTSDCTFHLTVLDLEPPAASCDQTTTVSIVNDDPLDCYTPADGCSGAGVTRIPASNFNDGSYDNCNNVRFTVRRMAPYSACIEGLQHTACAGGLSEYQVATLENDTIKFYCCEVGTTQTVILRVYQVDLEGDDMTDLDGNPIFNECMVQVEVQDKLKPTCIAPPTALVDCKNFDQTLWAYGVPQIADNCCLLSAPNNYRNICGLTVSDNYSNFDTVCNRGTIRRTFTVADCHNLSTTCTQLVVDNYNQDYYVRFPDDKIVTVCDGTTEFGKPVFYGEDCELLATSFQDAVYTVVEDACYKIERTWTVINWCTYNPNLPCIDVPNPNPTILNSAANLQGPIVSACNNNIPGWAPTIVRINPTDPGVTNYCTFYDANANCYKYKQIIKVIDGVAPVIQCPASPVIFCDLTANDPQLWNASYYYDQVSGSHDLCEGPVDLNITATDLCSLADINIHYLLFLDLDGDGVMETVVNSNTLPAANTVFFGNANNPNFSGGTPYQFDFRAVSAGQKYRFAVQTTVSGVNKTGYVRWNTTNSPTNYVIPELPYGTHKIKWFVSDGCGNESVCEYQFIVRDCKPPTVTCINGLSINIMPTNPAMIQVWAIDFILYADDNCTPRPNLKYGIRRSGTGTGFPVNSPGVTFTCADIGTQPVEIWAIDAAGNADFCETYVIVQDNFQACNVDGHATVAGALRTENATGLEEGTVELSAVHPTTAPITILDLSNVNGEYEFLSAVPLGSNLTVTPTKDNNPLNGVTTYDLALISKHILGIEPLASPYKMIAADANKSGSITTSDIVELRKLILGIYQELPNNTSWRFVDKSYVFPNLANPFSTPFPENKTVANIQASEMNDDFVAVKIGDVNQNAIANAQQAADDRTAGTLLLDIEDRTVKAGETFDVTFKTAEAAQGFQFTLKLNGLKVTEIAGGDEVSADNFGVFDNALTVSLDGAQEFTVRFRAAKAGKISELLSVSSEITKAEGYVLVPGATASAKAMAVEEVALRFSSPTGTTTVGVGFELYQNVPNPFVGYTSIGFNLPAAATATLTVYDESGRTIFTQKGDFAKGYNAIPLERSVLNTSDMLYYKLETATDVATKKMLQTK